MLMLPTSMATALPIAMSKQEDLDRTFLRRKTFNYICYTEAPLKEYHRIEESWRTMYFKRLRSIFRNEVFGGN